jgi:hypothetical protein
VAKSTDMNWWSGTWQRRAVTIPAITGLALVSVLALPIALPIAVVADLVRGKRFAFSRCALFFAGYLVGEVLFLAATLLHWLAVAGWTEAGRQRLLQQTGRVGNAWAQWMDGLGEHLFGLRRTVEGLGVLDAPGPTIALFRHASVGDTTFPPLILGVAAGREVRYVVKRELQLDPIFDVIGTRLGACFVARESKQAEREIQALCTLLDGLGPNDSVALFPEGTRFSPKKLARALPKLDGKLAGDALNYAKSLRRTLPPRLGGPIALLERNPGADVVFCAHAGYEGAATFADLIHGRTIGRTIQVRLWRVAYADIPREREALIAWLFGQWAAMDEWIDAQLTVA